MKRVLKKQEQQLWSIIKKTHVKKCQNEHIEKIKGRSFIFTFICYGGLIVNTFYRKVLSSFTREFC